MKCPNCGSEHVQYATRTSGGGFSGLDACCGYLFLGPLGILCGSCGSTVTTDEYWICHDCGKQFSNDAGVKNLEKIQQAKQDEETYQTNKDLLKAIETSDGGYASVRQEYENAKQHRKAVEHKYIEYLRSLKQYPDRKIRKAARKANDGKISSFLAGLILVSIALLFLVFPLGLTLLVLGIVWGIIVTYQSKWARELLAENLPEYVLHKTELDNAVREEKQLNALVTKINEVENYEETHKK